MGEESTKGGMLCAEQFPLAVGGTKTRQTGAGVCPYQSDDLDNLGLPADNGFAALHPILRPDKTATVGSVPLSGRLYRQAFRL